MAAVGMAGAGAMSGMRLSLGQVIQMMETQAPEGVVIQSKESWPPIAWVLLQAEADGKERGALATQLGIAIEDISDLVSDLIQAPDQQASEQIWQVGLIALRTSAVQVNHVIGKTWDQLEAMLIEKLADAIQNVNGKAADPEKLMAMAKIANSATRRSQGEGQRSGFGAGSMTDRVGAGIDVEMRSGDLGSITFRFSPRVAAQMQNPDRVIDSVARRVDPKAGMEMLRLKEIRPIAEAMDTEESKLKQEELNRIQAASREMQESLAPRQSAKDKAREAAEQFRFHDIMGVPQKGPLE